MNMVKSWTRMIGVEETEMVRKSDYAALEARLEECRKVRDEWCAEYTALRDSARTSTLTATLPNSVTCRQCGRKQAVNPEECLRHGWPKCHGQTMSLDSQADGTKP
jgi:hypothetical protein